MKAEQSQAPWEIWLPWTFATSGGLFASWVLVYLMVGWFSEAVGEQLGGEQVVNGPVGGAVLVVLLGMSFGTAQWLFLRQYHSQAGWWILATVVGFAVGVPVLAWLRPWPGLLAADPHSTVSEAAGYVGGWALDGAVLGLAVGLTQWLLLRQHLPRAGWWVLATAVGWVLTTAARGSLDVVSDTSYLSGPAQVMLVISLLVTVVGALGLITGMSLVWLLRQPRPRV